MKKKFYIFFIIVIMQACNINLYKQEGFKGEFISKTKYSAYKILIKEDNKIFVYRNIPNRSDTCIGKWNISSKNEIIVNCYGTKKFEDKLINAFLPSYDIVNDTIKVINQNKLEFNQMILERVR